MNTFNRVECIHINLKLCTLTHCYKDYTRTISYVEDGVCIIALDATCILFLASMYVLHMICCFYLLLHIDLSYIVKWFSFAFCVVIINNVVYCNLHIYVYVMKRKKKCCTYCMKNGKKKKIHEKKQDEIPPTLQHI